MTSELELDGLRLKMRELTDGELESLDEWVQGRFINAARQSVSEEDVGAEEWDRVLALAMREATKLTWSRQPGFNIAFATRRGLARVVWLGCREAHPTLTARDVYERLKSGRDVLTARGEFMRVNGLSYKAKAEGVAESYGNPTNVAVP
jgi:hypothetical protein